MLKEGGRRLALGTVAVLALSACDAGVASPANAETTAPTRPVASSGPTAGGERTIDCRTYGKPQEIPLNPRDLSPVRIYGDLGHAAIATGEPNGSDAPQLVGETPEGFNVSTNPDGAHDLASMVVFDGTSEAKITPVDGTGIGTAKIECVTTNDVQSEATKNVLRLEGLNWRVDTYTAGPNGVQTADSDENRIYPPN